MARWRGFEATYQLQRIGRHEWLGRLAPPASAAAASLYVESAAMLATAVQRFGQDAGSHFGGRDFLGHFMMRARNAGAVQI